MFYSSPAYYNHFGQTFTLPSRPVRPMEPAIKPEEKLPQVTIPSCSEWHDNTTPLNSQRLFDYMSPTQAMSLFAGGLASSVALSWFTRGLMTPKKLTLDPFKSLAKNANERQKQMTAILDEGLPAVVLMAFENPHLQKGLKAYAGASVLGYVLGSLLQGVQEVWIRREETQIRANLIRQMSHSYAQSLQMKTFLDQQLKEQAKQRISELLKQYQIPNPEKLMDPEPMIKIDSRSHQHYPFEVSHLTVQPGEINRYRFGQKATDQLQTDTPWHTVGLKSLVFGVGMVTGLLGQAILGMLKQAPGQAALPSNAKRISYEIFNVRNWEALFLAGNGRLLMGLLGLAAAAKVGKSLIDGYREIEVTRKNADTELRYQVYNWKTLDPAYHKIAETVALDSAIRQLEKALPYEAQNRYALRKRIEAILTNIGRNSAPKYFQMTPPVNLVAARS